ncbi:glycosyltransferase family 2 protein [Rhodobaculum claviforme]|nr:glycosyltransferase family 2 protein [Rhodobaculum claviforme]
MPKLTCITTTFNDGPVLMTSVRAVLGQSFGDFEYLVVDDGSSDATPEILAGLEDPRLRVIRQANDGLSGARNTALAQARGDYVCFLDADDCRPNWAFQAIADAIDAAGPDTPPDLVLCRGVLSEVRDELRPFYDTPVFEAIEALCPDGVAGRTHPHTTRLRALAQILEPQAANKAVRTQFLRDAGLRFPDTHFFEDIFFHTNALATADRLAFVQTPCFTYFRRYQRPQITATASDTRFDILAVMRMTLQSFATRLEFHDPEHRAAVLLSCLKLADWCGKSISHYHRYHYYQMLAAVLRLSDPLWLHLPDPLPEALAPLGHLRRHLPEVPHAA